MTATTISDLEFLAWACVLTALMLSVDIVFRYLERVASIGAMVDRYDEMCRREGLPIEPVADVREMMAFAVDDLGGWE